MIRLYVRELREVSGVEVQPLRQPLHQLGGLGGGEGPGGEKQAGVMDPNENAAAIHPLKPSFSGRCWHSSENPQMGHCARAQAVFVLHTRTHKHGAEGGRAQTHTNGHGAVPRETGSAASSGLLNHLPFFKPRDKQ